MMVENPHRKNMHHNSQGMAASHHENVALDHPQMDRKNL
jgi:hypothetical protein